MMNARYQLLERGVFDHTTRSNVLPHMPEWDIYREWLTAGGIPLPMDAIGQVDLADAQASRIAEIEAYAAGLRNKIIAGISAGEMSSWPLKIAEARLWTASGDDADAPMLAATAQIRGIPMAEMVAKVMGAATPFAMAEAAIDGTRGKHCDAINAMTDVRDVVVYDWRAGWPAL
jgi:hypothetical protein